MDFITAAATDIGLTKQTNQDSFGVKVMNTGIGKVVLAVLCDGMGGLSKGEGASATVVDAFSKWANDRLPYLCSGNDLKQEELASDWNSLVTQCNERIKAYGARNGVSCGTTITALLLTQKEYVTLNVGDSRSYEITDAARQLTKDQSVVGREIELGILTEEQAKVDPRRSVLLQCIGASETVVPDIGSGEIRKDAVYFLSSDGFVHEITSQEMQQNLNAQLMGSKDQMCRNLTAMIELNKQRMESDNISVVAIRTL